MWSTKKALITLSIISLLVAPVSFAAPTTADDGPGITDLVIEFFDGLLEAVFGAGSDNAPTPPAQGGGSGSGSGGSTDDPIATTQDGGGGGGCEMGPFSDPSGC